MGGAGSIRWKAAALLPILVLAVDCAGDGRPGATDADSPTTVRALFSTYPSSLSLIGKTDQNTEILALQITDSLVQYDAELNLQPRLAESWEFSEDRLTVTFHLRQGVRFHDGEPVTAKDVVFSVEKVREPATENRSFGSLFKDLLSVEAIDARTVRARYSEATPDVLDAWRVPIVPEHLAGADSDVINGAFSRHPVGCGPFRFVRAATDQEIVLEANDDYWDGRPHIDRLVFKIYPDQRTAYEALKTGDLDIGGLSSNLFEEARRSDAAGQLDSFVYATLRVWPILWNQDGSNPYFTDPRVRKALILALDREQFIDSVIHGLARPGTTTFHPDTPWADPGLEPRRYDPAEAARLLDEAGWVDSDRDGIRDRDGRPFSFALLIPQSPMKLTDHMASWQQQSWAEIGVKMEIEKLEWVAFKERRNAHQFEAAAFTLLFTPNPDMFELYHSTARDSGFNFMGLADPEIDRLLEEGRRAFDVEARREIYYRLQRRLHELEPLTCLFYFSSPVVHDQRLEGVRPSAIGYARTLDGPRLWRWNESG